MTQPLLDYDATDVPANYDLARDHGPRVRNLWMTTVQSRTRHHGAVRNILDLGCGTGRFTSGLSERFDADVIGVDPSIRMLAQAHVKPHGSRIRYLAARGEDLPLPDGDFDLVFMSMVFHHFQNHSRVARECRRVVRNNGVVFMRAGTSDRIPAYPYVPFFPASLPLLHDILPSVSDMRDVFEAAGFQTLAQDVLVQEIAPTHAAYADKLARGADSVLIRLPAADFEQGLAELRAHAQRIDPQPVTEPIDYLVFA